LIPSALSAQIQQGLADFLRFSFWSSTPGMEHVVEDLIAAPGELSKGPYISLKLPFVPGRTGRRFPGVPLDFTPHAHQERAFERLGGHRKRSTLVATGTGSGKTESFLVPILDHCLQEAGRPGVKAVLIYPMNALATDQALRLAKLIASRDTLRGTVRAGLFIGETKGKKGATSQMGPASIITDREAMRQDPPDILLTNYKMLDYLLLRPKDQGVWRHNQRGTLRFLVVDEIHTFDGAQGTDLACLVRRLKRRLQVDDGSLCCVGTSATLGGPEAADHLREYAEQVFGEQFDAESVVAEERLTADAFLAGVEAVDEREPEPEDAPALDPAQATDPETWLVAQHALWFDDPPDAPDANARAVLLGDRLKAHRTFQSLLGALRGRAVALDDLVAELSRARSAWQADPAFARLALGSLLALVSAARSWREERPEARAAREAAAGPRPSERFVDARVQLWHRELARMVATVGPRPRLRHSDDLDREARRTHLPLVHCRECGSMGWVTRVDRDRPHVLRAEQSALYRDFFAKDPRVEYLYPHAAIPWNDPAWHDARPARIEASTLTALAPGEDSDGPTVDVGRLRQVRSSPKGEELSRDCPFCGAGDSLALVGFRAATLTSVSIDQMFASPFNDDKKLLTFSDSVQDAAHRAGFFGARTWATNLRVAMLGSLPEAEPTSVADLADRVGAVWKARLDRPTWVSTFLAPNMTWLHDWESLQKTGALPDGSELEELVRKRLAYEVVTEFGLQAGVGRSLCRTDTIAVALDPARLDHAVGLLLEPLRNEVAGLRSLTPERLRRFVVGLLAHLRRRGGILSDALPAPYIESAGEDIHSFKRAHHLPGFGPTSRLPALLTDRPGRGRFESWSTRHGRSWYARRVAQCLGRGEALSADAASLYPVLLPGLTRAGLLRATEGAKGARIWGLDPTALLLTRDGAPVRCARCGARQFVPTSEHDLWLGMACLSPSCAGSFAQDRSTRRDYFGRLYAHGDLRRIFTAEHTGLLPREERERVETEFKAPEPGPAVDDALARKAWYPNLLSCTPTLEMGIDIGDLSTAILCSVPPRQSAYLQRIGRAGRRDGNALVLTVANARPHDLYFYATPQEMMEGDVSPPGVFLDAAAVLQRQLTAFCFDHWVRALGDGAVLPPTLREVFPHLDEPGAGRFPHNLLAFIDTNKPRIWREFQEMFAGAISGSTAGWLERFLLGTDGGDDRLGWGILEALRRELKQRDTLTHQARAIRDQMKALKEDPASPIDLQARLDDLETEKEALLALVKAINNRMTLEFLTDEGLLPNYAFPEAAVRLKSVIWRRKKKVPSSGSKFETWTHEYARTPASAISELAPNADFYARGRRVKVDQVDLTVSEIETWRFCDACNHAQPVHTGDELVACPACRSGTWRDDGQRVRMLRLRQVYANAPDRESRIKDDHDDRRPRYFQRQMLVDVADEHRRGAWRLKEERVPFGFEYLDRVTFREVNFGDHSEDGAKSLIAGREAVRGGFEICARCGKVQERNKDPRHSFTCPSQKKGQAAKIEACLYLYREFSSEALRILLPTADPSTSEQLNSFVAALQAGLIARFGGSVDHLRTTVYTEPVADSALRRQYLVLFDTVPGGTGYIEQLVTPAAEGGELPIFEVMQLALARIEGCSCQNDPDRDGCYRCIFAYRNAQDMDDTRASTAIRLLRRILEHRGELETIQSLGDISINGLMDSVLEVRFVEALRAVTRGNERARLKLARINHKPGWFWSLGDASWTIEPQVHLPDGDGSGVSLSIDFLLRPVSTTQARTPIAVFTDGWEYHKGQIGKDLCQRMALQATGRYDVWSFTWADLDEALTDNSSQGCAELILADHGAFKSALGRMKLGALARPLAGPLFSLFVTDLTDGMPWREIGNTALASQMVPAVGPIAQGWRDAVARGAPKGARKVLLEARPTHATPPTAAPFALVSAMHDGQPHVVVHLDDRPEHLDHPDFKASWRGFLRAYQLLRAVPEVWFTTATSVEGLAREFEAITLLRSGATDGPWRNLDDLDPRYGALAAALQAAGVPPPEIGYDVPDARGDVWVSAELAWEDARVAITERAVVTRAKGAHSSDWTVLFLDDLAEGPGPALAALHRAEAG
jgi:DEAD/DEAH box helicase domain-containing protein